MEYREALDLSRKNGIPYRSFRGRIESGWTIEQASTLPRYTRISKNVRGKIEDEITYRTKQKEWVY